jgi:16S rRNA (cytosine967-C5)-methyltransferase
MMPRVYQTRVLFCFLVTVSILIDRDVQGFLSSRHGLVRDRVTANADTLVFRNGIFLSRKLSVEESDVTVTEKQQSPPSPARFLAVQALFPSKGPSGVERLTNSKLGFNNLPVRDRAFCRVMVTTVERRSGQIDAVLSHCQTKKPDSSNTRRRQPNMSAVDKLVQAVLRVGAVQVLFLDVPSHAAVKETVDVLRMKHPQLRERVPESKIKFVNAILRRLSREGDDILKEYSKVEDNASPWLVKEWKRTWGEEATQGILTAAMEETPRCLTVLGYTPEKANNQRRAEETEGQRRVEAVAASFDGAEILPQGSVRIPRPPPGPVSSWVGYQEGAWFVQDLAATIPAMALYLELSQGGTRSVHDMEVVDLCAAPGGKTAQLSSYGFVNVTAVEVSKRRCERLKENMERLHMNWNVVVADGTEWIPERRVSGVLVDAPCTATGTASKRPDVLRRDSNYEELLDVQYELACHAADEILAPGGTMIYATCSLLKQESEDQVLKLLQREEGVSLECKPFLPGDIPAFDKAIDENGYIRVIPGALPQSLGQCDGFFVAKLVRID